MRIIMRISSFQAAKTMCHMSGWTLTNLKLQKLTYLAHMISLGRGNPLIDSEERFRAWAYGPVLPSLYDRVKIFGNSAITDRFYQEELLEVSDINYGLLQEIFNFFGKMDGWELVGLTHRPDGAWAKNYEVDSNAIISEEDILQEYKNQISK